MSRRGVRQGSVFGPLFFAVALQPILDEAKRLFPEAIFRAYLDDITFSSSLSDVQRISSQKVYSAEKFKAQ
jgi:hypothetical protein